MTATAAYFAHVDGLRALAVVAVLVYHLDSAWLPGGFVGVDVFFVISGYVVTASLARHQGEDLGRFLARFYARRLVRLMPALVVMLVAATLLYVLLVPRAWFNRAAETTGQAAFWGLSNWVLDRQVVNYFEPRAEFNPFTHTWSLGLEEQFYVLAPLLLFFALGTGFSVKWRSAAATVIALLALGSFALCFWWGWARGARSVFYLLPFRFWELAAGVLLFLAGGRRAGIDSAWQRWQPWVECAGALFIAAALLLPKTQAYPWLRAAIAVAGTMMLVGPPTLQRQGVFARWLSAPMAVWLGLRSYSLYLWHWPVFVIARWTVGLDRWPFNLLAVLVSLSAAWLCHRLIENPVRHAVARHMWPPSASILLMLALLTGGWLSGRVLLEHQPVLGLGQATRQAPDWYGANGLLRTTLAASRQCEPRVEYQSIGPAPQGLMRYVPIGCSRPSDRQLFVIGDSHATAYLPLLEQLSAEQGRRVDVIQVPGCAYLDFMAPMRPEVDATCHAAAAAGLQHVLSEGRPGDVVFLASLRLPRLIHLGGQRRDAPDGDVFARSNRERTDIALASHDAPRWITPLTDAGLQVVLELPKPVFRAHPFTCVDTFTRGNPLCRDGLVEARADQERYRAPVVGALRRLATEIGGVSVWDPLPALCGDTHCDALRDGRPLFFDADHLSPFGNLVLLPALRGALTGTDDGPATNPR